MNGPHPQDGLDPSAPVSDSFVPRTSDCVRMIDMMAAANQDGCWKGRVRTDDGWRQPLPEGDGFRHEYDEGVADGAWEFRILRPGLSIAIVNYTVKHGTPRLHRLGDMLVLSTVLSGTSQLDDGHGFEGRLADGYCTLYGVYEGDQFETFYAPDTSLKWVSIFIERDAFFDITGLGPEDLPPGLIEFLRGEAALSPRNIPLSNAALVAASDILENSMTGGYKRAYLTAKALELACQILHILSRSLDDGLRAATFTRAEFERVTRAKSLLEQNLDAPLNVDALARAVGMTRQKLQLGFRLLYGDTVARVRDKFRMKHALDLVRSSEMSIIEIALEAGYEHHASFTRAFRAAFGTSPLHMRKVAHQAELAKRMAG